MLPLCADQGIGVIPWSPLARGKLTRPWDEATTRKLLRNPQVTSPIVGVTKPAHRSDAIAAVDVTLDADEVTALEAPYLPHTVAGFQ